jgi:hypothetical protein
VFKTKRGDVLKKRREIFGVGRKWVGATSTTTSFALIFSDLVAWCWICRRILIFNEENVFFMLSLIKIIKASSMIFCIFFEKIENYSNM